METTYKNKIPSQFEAVRNEGHPVQDIVHRCTGTYALEAEITIDEHTLSQMKHVDGLVAFLCVLKRDGKVISRGYGSSVISPSNRYFARAIQFAFNSSLADACIRATKVLGTFQALGEDVYATQESSGSSPATTKQREYLQQLIQINIEDEDEREQMIAELPELSRQEASQKIASLKA